MSSNLLELIIYYVAPVPSETVYPFEDSFDAEIRYIFELETRIIDLSCFFVAVAFDSSLVHVRVLVARIFQTQHSAAVEHHDIHRIV